MEQNDLQSLFPEIAKEWHPTLNGDLLPSQVAKASNKPITWLCPKGHTYVCSVYKRTGRGTGCPFCAGKRVLKGFNDLKSRRPDIVEDWDYVENEKIGLHPDQVSPGSNKFAYWKCHVCGYKWRTKINDRYQGRGCAECAKPKRIKSFRESRYLRRGENDLGTIRPDFLNEWDSSKNADKKPSDYTSYSSEKIWWKCSVCGYSWKATIANRYNNHSGCPKCMKHKRTSFPEQAILFYLLRLFPDVENSYTALFSNKTEIDVFIPSIKVGIEYDGMFWHKSERDVRKAKEKYEVCKKEGIRLVRVSELPDNNIDYCDDYIYRKSLTDEGLNEALNLLFDLLRLDRCDIDVTRDRAEIIKQYITVLKNRSIAVRAPESAAEWDVELNDGLTAEMVNSTSNHVYWWRCPLGHPYRSSPANKTSGKYGCSVCSGHQLIAGVNDFATLHPKLAILWDDVKNYPTKVSDVRPGSQVKYYWICDKGHSFISSPNDLVYASGSGCGVCNGKQTNEGVNDLKTTSPEVLQFWDYEANNSKGICPEKVTKGSSRMASWKCSVCGQTWEKRIGSQVKFNSCPICEDRLLVLGINDLKTRHPELALEWNFEKNTEVGPDSILSSYMKKVWWKCLTCGNTWLTSPYNRLYNKTGCPQCGYAHKMQESLGDRIQREHKDLVSLFPEIAAEWDYEKNVGLDPHRLSPGSNKKVWWICPKGHSYDAWMSDRTGKHHVGCKYCSKKRKLPQQDTK